LLTRYGEKVMAANRPQDRNKGDRAEEVASWYFRLNGFLSIPGFVVHPDQPHPHPRTEADLMAVRFPHSVEKIGESRMDDDYRLTNRANDNQVLFVLVEVKAGRCDVNGPWSRRKQRNMHRAISRLGFATNDTEIDDVASAMYQSLRWENPHYVLQYVSVGAEENNRLTNYLKTLTIGYHRR
jgi:hypothetical protein